MKQKIKAVLMAVIALFVSSCTVRYSPLALMEGRIESQEWNEFISTVEKTIGVRCTESEKIMDIGNVDRGFHVVLECDDKVHVSLTERMVGVYKKDGVVTSSMEWEEIANDLEIVIRKKWPNQFSSLKIYPERSQQKYPSE